MGSCGSGVGGIGPIVWVRRRNGSWWPGKILGPKELSECNLSSPRTGTPVKLLGREDASVDWYNLEKSKRVKAFRCGEFDECIEKAESAHGMPIKKREKYARREDAILHALELEKQLMVDRVKPIVATVSAEAKLCENDKKAAVSVANDVLGNNSGNHENGRMVSSSKLQLDVKNEREGSPIISSGAKYTYPCSWEEEHSEATPRMRGLQDLGVVTASSKRKFSSFKYDGSGRESQFPLSSAPTLEKISYINGGNQMGSVHRAKRSRCIYSSTGIGDPLDERDPSLDLVKISPRSDGSDMNHQRVLMKDGNSSSGVIEDGDSDYSQSDSSDSDSDSSETEPDTNDVTVSSDMDHNAVGQDGARGDQESTSMEEPEDSAFSGDIAHLYSDDPYLTNEAVSKWQLKGKRNIRCMPRESSMPAANGEYNNRPLRNGAKTSILHHKAFNVDNPNLHGKRNNLIDWEDITWEGRSTCSSHWENGRQYFSSLPFGRHHFGGRARPMLIDVDLKVQSRYQRERVPIISLLSKLNGMAIVGYPIQTECLEDGSSGSILLTKEDYGWNGQNVQDWNPSLPPAWKSARRRNFRVPRPNVASVLNGDGDDLSDFTLNGEQERRLPFKKVANFSNLSQNSGLLRRNLGHSPRLFLDKRFSRKPTRKQGLSSNQKTRTLSSIGSHHSFGTKMVNDSRSYPMNVLAKAEMAGPPIVACIQMAYVHLHMATLVK